MNNSQPDNFFEPGKPIKIYVVRMKIVPPRCGLSIGNLGFNFIADDGNHFQFDLKISDDAISGNLKTQTEDLNTIRNHLCYAMQHFLDSASIFTGRPSFVYLESLRNEKGVKENVEIIFSEIAVFSESLPFDINGLWQTIMAGSTPSEDRIKAQVMVRRALADIRLGMFNAIDTAFHCYRAMELLLPYFDPADNLKKKDAWAQYRAILRLDEALLIKASELSKFVRHGETEVISAETRTSLLLLALNIMERFILFVEGNTAALNGKIVLTLNEFPYLDT